MTKRLLMFNGLSISGRGRPVPMLSRNQGRTLRSNFGAMVGTHGVRHTPKTLRAAKLTS